MELAHVLCCSLACAVGATEHLLWISRASVDTGRAHATEMDLTAPAPAPVRNIQALHKRTHSSLSSLSNHNPISSWRNSSVTADKPKLRPESGVENEVLPSEVVLY